MNATERGFKIGGEYIRVQPIEERTPEQYRLFGGVLARQYCKSELGRQRFMLGWYHGGKRFFELMKGQE